MELYKEGRLRFLCNYFLNNFPTQDIKKYITLTKYDGWNIRKVILY